MQITVLLFAELAEAVAERQVAVELVDGADVDAAIARLGDAHPAIRERAPTLAVAVNEQYVHRSHQLQDGDVLALIGPVSGG